MTDNNGHKLVLRLSWPILLLLVIILVTSFGLSALPFILSPASELSGITASFAEGHSISRVVTLIVVVPAILMLALRDAELGAAALAALAAIAGYVLGGTLPK
jgi:hypothetical protein